MNTQGQDENQEAVKVYGGVSVGLGLLGGFLWGWGAGIAVGLVSLFGLFTLHWLNNSEEPSAPKPK